MAKKKTVGSRQRPVRMPGPPPTGEPIISNDGSEGPLTTGDGTEIPRHVAQELADWRLRLIPAVVAERVWNRLFNDDDRVRLGNDLQLAWQDQGTMSMYMRARQVTYERAMLEIAVGVGQMPEADYERLLLAIGGINAGRLRPRWDRDRSEVTVGERLARKLRGRSIATNLRRVLDTFESLDWPSRIVDPLPGDSDKQRLREVVASLNRGLAIIKFASDGTGRGITWKFR